MDLTDILRKRTEADLAVAMARSLELSLEIEAVAQRLKGLREASEQAHGRRAAEVAESSAADFGAKASTERRVKSLPASVLLRKITARQAAKPRFHWHFDEIAGVFPARDKGGVNAVISSTSVPVVTLSGWVVPMEGHPAFHSVDISLTGGRTRIERTTQTHRRPDVADHFGNPDLSQCGFRVEIPMFEIPVGEYNIDIICRTSSGSEVSSSMGTVTIS